MLSAWRILAIWVDREHCTIQNFAERICKIYMEMGGCKEKTSVKTTPSLLVQGRSMTAPFTGICRGLERKAFQEMAGVRHRLCFHHLIVSSLKSHCSEIGKNVSIKKIC